MTTAEFLAHLRRLGVEVSSDGDRPRVVAPKGVLTPALREELTARREEIAAFLKQIRPERRSQTHPLVPVDRGGLLPLSFAQQRLWFLTVLEPDRADYNTPIAMRLTGRLDVAALRAALTGIVNRHEVLRTTFGVSNGVPHQVIAPPGPVPLPLTDLMDTDPDDAVHRAEQLIAADVNRPFDLVHGPLIRGMLQRVAADDHMLALTLHHVVADEWSLEILNTELSALYAAIRDGRPSPLPPLPVQYADFTVWQRDRLGGEVLDSHLAYWRRHLADLSTLDLPADRRPQRRTSAGAVVHFDVPPDTTARLRTLAGRHGASMFMVLLAAFKVVLARYTGNDDIAVGTMVANRERAETQHLIGLFANTLVLRTDLSGDPTFEELLGQVREVVLGALAHQDVPFERLVDEVAPARDPGRSPLFQVMFTFQASMAASSGPQLSGTSGCALSVPQTTTLFDLTLAMGESEGQLLGGLEYSTDLFERATAERIAAHVQSLLASVAVASDARLSAIPLPDDGAGDPSPTRLHPLVDDLPVYEQVRRWAERTPDAVAVVAGDEQLSYSELDGRADRLAGRLRTLGVSAESVVALCLDRTVEAAVAIQAVWKAGGAYLPLDPDDPPDRVAALLADAAPIAVVTTRARLGALPAHPAPLVVDDVMSGADAPAGPTGSPPTGAALAYVIYTSGSTGGPKGVAVTHGNLAQLAAAWREAHRNADRPDTWLTTASVAFDVFSGDWLRALTNGGTLIIAPIRLGLSPRDLVDTVNVHNVTALECSPAVLVALLDHLEATGAALPTLRLLVVATDRWLGADRDRVVRLLGPDLRLLAAFGLTETSVDSTYFHANTADLAPDRVVPIGHALPYTACYVLDRMLRHVPTGVPGELYVGGSGVARGYTGRAVITAERFVADPVAGDGSRMYRTGDRVRRHPGGALEFLGRVDDQANVRGHRVEPGEVETALRSHPDVVDAVVLALPDPALAGQLRLVAYVVTRTPEAANGPLLRHFLADRLPGPFVPSVFVALDAVPQTRNGKVDRRALAARPVPSAEPTGGRPTATPTEKIVAGIWADLLGMERVGATDDFFNLGGHSMLAAQVAWRLTRTTGVEVPLSTLFEATTVRALAQALDEAGHRVPGPPVLARSTSGDSDAPLSFSQQRLWLLAQLEPDSVEYNVPAAIRLTGPLDVTALRRSIDEIVARHEVLSTSFHTVDGSPRQVIATPTPTPLPVIELSHLPPDAATARANQLVAEHAAQPFDLAHDRLLRATLLRLAADDHILALTMHHIVCDEWSTGILQRELSTVYAAFQEGRPSPLPPLPVQYADFAAWQHTWLRGDELDRQLAYWRRQLADLPALEVPGDRPRPPVRSAAGATVDFAVPGDVSGRLRTLSRRHDTTMFTTLLAAFQALLARYTGQPDVVVGAPVSGRVRPETENLIGFFVNTLVLRSDLSGDPTFADLLTRVRRVVLAAFAHQDLPFERLVEELQPTRDRSRTPLFSVLFAYAADTAAAATPVIGPGEVCGYPVEFAVAQFDISVTVADHGGPLDGVVEYSTALFDRVTAQRFADHFVQLLTDIVADADRPLSRMSLLTGAELDRLSAHFRGPARSVPTDRVDQVVSRHARARPDAAALVASGERWTYAALESQANRLAWHLRSLGVGPEIVVGVLADREPALVIGLLGVLKAGGAYLPLDPAYPHARLRFMLTDAAAAMVCVADGVPAETLPPGLPVVRLDDPAIAAWPADPPHCSVEPANLAYVVYTSGSTGTPKGALVSHHNLRHLLAGWVEAHRIDEPWRWLSLASPSFDVFSGDWVRALGTGGALILGRQGLAADPPELARLLTDEAVSALELSPAVLAALLGESHDWLGRLRLLIMASDPWYGAAAARLVPFLPDQARVVTAFGITETTVDSTWWEGDLDTLGPTQVAPIGRPLPNTSTYVLDDGLTPVPLGVPGELYIGGAGVGRGYTGRPDLTAQRFVPDPFAGGGARMYRTGDRVRWRGDGNLEFLGRTDDQVRLRGHRIEPAEVQAVLLTHPAVAQAAVAACGGAVGDERLVAWLVPADGAQMPRNADLRAFLAKRLPEYMVPAGYQVLDALPLTPNGKVDRRALTAQAPPAPESEPGHLPPRTTAERVLAEIWASLLGTTRVGVDDNFFDLGGHSLLAMQAVSRLRAAFGVDLAFSALFERPVLADLAVAVETARGGVPEPPLRPVPREPLMPLSFAQQRLWVLDQLDPGSAEYNVPSVLRLRGPLDIAALRRALSELLTRHEGLRARFIDRDGTPYVVVGAPEPVPLPVTDLSALAGEAAEVSARQWVMDQTTAPFDLGAGPVLRAALLRYGDGDHLLAVTMHHIVCDEWSTGIVQRELSVLYRAFSGGEPAPLDPLPLQYVDFAVWQRAWLRGEALDRQLAYWRAQLGELAALDLPTDRPRPAFRSTAGAAVHFTVDGHVLTGLRTLSRDQGTTLFMTLLAAFQIVLGRYAGQNDVAVGTPLAGRVRPETESLVGFFVNTVVLRTDLSGDPTFDDLLARVRRVALGAFAHQDLPFERLVEELAPHRDLSRTPLFQVLFNLEQATDGADPAPLGTVDIGEFPVPCVTTNFDLTLTVVEHRDALLGTVEYSTALFDAPTVERLARYLTAVLAEVAADPARRLSRLPTLLPDERTRVLREWNDTRADTRPALVHEAIAETAVRTPDRLAVEAVDGRLTHADLDRRANQLAHHLRTLGVGPETLVGLYLERSTALVVGMVAVLRAGGAYLPLDPRQPAARTGLIVGDARPAVVVTEHRFRDRLPPGPVPICLDEPAVHNRLETLPAQPPPGRLSPANLAYVIYTSGSTGTPKGVQVEHGSLRNFLASMATVPGLAADDVLLSVTTPSFDIAALELLLPLYVGAVVRLADEDEVHDPSRLVARLADGITVMQATPATWRMLVEAGWPGRPDLRALCGGEALDQTLAGELSDRCGEAWNLYGPTESTIWSTVQRLPAAGVRTATAPIGGPVANTRVYVLDEFLRPVAVNVPGELHIAGAGVARGYAGQPALTARRFIADPFGGDGGRMYRTGDRARWRPDGRLEYLGRLDDQIKVRGFRVEPAEVEVALMAHPDIADATVIDRTDVAGQRLLVGHLVVRAGGAAPDAVVLREFLGRLLPDYMVPATFVVHDRLPSNPSGKVDRAALARETAPRPHTMAAGAPPRTSVERTLAGLWAALLGLDRVETGANFFELGGHSLLATQLVSRIRSAFGVQLPLRTVFEAPTVAALAGLIATGEQAVDQPVRPALRDDTAPLSFAQQRLWVLDQLEPGGTEYTIAKIIELSGPFDLTAFERALDELVARHETLRTRFDHELGVPRQVIAAPQPVPLNMTDLGHLPESDAAARAHQQVTDEISGPVSLHAGPLFRAAVVRLGPQKHVVALVMHHIVCDEWSVRTVERELALLYAAFSAGRPSPLPPLEIQYADFAIWQRERSDDDLMRRQLGYWCDRLAGVPVLELPTDRPRPAVRCPDGDTVRFVIGAEDAARLRALSRREGVTAFMTMLAAFQAVLSRWAGQTDVAVGTPIAGRTRLELEDVVGCFVNTLVLRTDLSGDPTFTQLLHRVREVALGAYAHQDLPFERLVERLQPDRDRSRTPLFQVIFNYEPAPEPVEQTQSSGLDWCELPPAAGTAKFDLRLSFVEGGGVLSGAVEYSTALFDRSTMERFAHHVVRMLTTVAADPARRLSDVPLLTAAERRLLVHDWAGSGPSPVPGQLVHERFSDQAARTPHDTAVVTADTRATYAELEGRANRLAHHLRANGVGPDVLVALCLHPGLDLLVSVLAVLKAGGAYLTLDPREPLSRLAAMLKISGAAVVVTREDLTDLLPAGNRAVVCLDDPDDAATVAARAGTPPPATVGALGLAYVLFTSGSTGVPKAVAVTHAGLAGYVDAVRDRLELAPGARYGLAQPLSVDFGVTMLFPALTTGGEVHLLTPDVVTDAGKLADHLARGPLDYLKLVPSHLAALSRNVDLARLLPRRALVLGGEPAPLTLVRAAAALLPAGAVYNHYGPTETTVGVTAWRAPVSAGSDGASVPIGAPLPHARAYVVDAALQPVPVGVPGELFVGGPAVARGYLGRPELTAERFIADPFAGDGNRLYRTGDRVRWREDGTLEFLGRLDAQVKVRGFRVEPGEVEAAVTTHPAIAEAAVCLDRDAAEPQLVAYLVPHDGSDVPPAGDLRRFLTARLPDAFVPARFATVTELPRTAAGKLDRRALVGTRGSALATAVRFVPPTTPTEHALAGIWRELLGAERVGVDDDFFDLGGHSLLATQVIWRIRTGFGVEPSLATLFDNPTLGRLADAVDTLVWAADVDPGTSETDGPDREEIAL
ncbi:non-ribosomal peptide synthetase [Virgisporangium aurantiacum]|uniref:Carrier domain-containing protein n=1 Tax=Virgisporangium aurantiacum TaxID=175570 RepID=A0A8J3ZKY7_9ACTN|nr:non-ribosomal peptide synthetase [Virgisporangium aurantiacum]GIJ64867.1 hypothetical protein Vau01_123830 [Virgisporangium aurantiacum]